MRKLRLLLPAAAALLFAAQLGLPPSPPSHSPGAQRRAQDARLILAAQSAAQDASGDEGVEEAKAKKLSGTVSIADEGSPLATVLIEECDPSFSKVLASTHSDRYGNFDLKPGRRGKVHYLRISADGFVTQEYEVTLSPDAPDALKLQLHLAAKPQSFPARKPSGRVFEL